MKLKGSILVALACFAGLSLFLLTEGSLAQEPGPAIYGITYVMGVAANGVYVEFSIQHGDDDDCWSYHDQGDGNYHVGRLWNWGYWTLEATFWRNDSLFYAKTYGYRQQSNPHADNVDLYLLFLDDTPDR